MEADRYRDCELDDLAGTIGQLYALTNAVYAELLDVMAAFIERQGHLVDGMRDPASWLAAQVNLSLTTARRVVEVAVKAPQIPALMEAFAEGRISWDQLVVLAAVATSDTDAELAAQAPGWTYHATMVNARALKPVTAKDEVEQHRQRYLQLIREPGATLRIRGRLSGEQAEIVHGALNRLAELLPEEGRLPDAEPVRRGARLADALVNLCAGEPQLLAQQPARPLVVVHVPVERLASDSEADVPVDGEGGQPTGPSRSEPSRVPVEPATIGNGWAIADETARRLACDCRWQMIADDPSGRTVGIGRESRRVPPWMARIVNRRDRFRCRWPRCDRTVWLEHHHVTHWAYDGFTEPENLVSLCWHHHHLVHEGRWQLTYHVDTDTVTLTRPDGHIHIPRSEPDMLSEHTRNWLTGLTGSPSTRPRTHHTAA